MIKYNLLVVEVTQDKLRDQWVWVLFLHHQNQDLDLDLIMHWRKADL